MSSPETERGRSLSALSAMLSGEVLPLPGDPQEHSPPMDPPWKRATVAQQAPDSPTITPRLSWGDSSRFSESARPRSPRTPCRRACEPPSPPCREACRRRPPSDDEDEAFVDDGGRLAREFCELTPIGRGQFSTVLQVRSRIDHCLYAVKKTTRVSRGLQDQLREVFALASVGVEAEASRNIVRYFSSWLEDGRLHIQTELCKCSLRDCLAERTRSYPSDPRFSEEDLVEVLRDVARGLAILHARNFVHLDIKPDNILISRGSQGFYKIADLGLAAAAIGSSCEDISEGDCRYLAKEVLRGELADLPKADVFSLGLVAYELATNPKELPINGEEWHIIRTGQLDTSLLRLLPKPLLALVQRMVDQVPGNRPSCEELCEHLSVAPEDELQALEEELRQRTMEAERNRQLADEYRAELMNLKRQEVLRSDGRPTQPVAGGRPVASPAAFDVDMSMPGSFAIFSGPL